MSQNTVTSSSIIKSSDVTSLLSYSGKRKVPLIMQSEVAECGLACLAMIASFYHYHVNLSFLRKKIIIDSNGMSLRQLTDVASELHLSSRALKCPLEDIVQLKLPCVIHWNMEHFVVLTGVTKKAVYINDPAFGKRKIGLKEFSNSFTGIALELTPTTDFKKQDARIVMSINQLWEKIVGLKRSLVALFILSVVMQCAALLSPYYMQWVIDSVLLSNDTALLVTLAVGFSLLMLIQTGIEAFRSWLVLRFTSALNLQMGANLFHHLLRLPMSYFEKRHIGDITSKFGALSSIQNILTTGLIEALIDGMMALIILVLMYMYNTMLATLVLGIVVVSFIIQLAFYYPNRQVTEESIIAEAKEDTIFLETIRSIQTVKLFSHEASRQNSWLNRYAEVININIRLGKLNIAEDALNNILFGLESSLVIYFGALVVIEGNLTVGMLLAFIAYKGQFTTSITRFIDNILSFKLVSLHLERLSDIALQEKEHFQMLTTSPLREVKGSIRLENICFRYSDNAEWILFNISFEIKAGESIAITGPSGCGKTTVLKIILGLLKPTSGRIYLDGIESSSIKLSDYRQCFGAVMQNDILLSGTLIENITLFDAQYNEELLNECCEMACIIDDIDALPMGYNSLVGDMGNNFSGGQLQRIFLARALYKKPKILCLDESTSHLDQKNEGWINQNISMLSMTRIVIAHRKETIESVDRVLKLNEIGV
ncbi:peptidase domain-containing ABC transporter [Photobacterium profundum]|uniref:Toxin transporter n=1 Tax=Photobacterium profundum (strain SS9) TaxID=298386 RepID=Q6LVI9_PHOPR|nr:peptidase domain-containing ABC transporter [Photobacterium profundum]CAG18686.1 putative toxin transporter [Photobacterium profundum SS9]